MKRFALLLLLTSCGTGTCFAGDLAAIRARGELLVSVKNVGARAIRDHKDPAHFEKREMEIALAHLIAQHILGDAGHVSFRMMRKPQRLRAVADGEVDLGISMLRVTPEAAREVDFSIPYFTNGLAVLESADSAIAGKRDLAGKALAVVSRNDGDAAAMVAAVTDPSGPAPRAIPVADFRAGVQAIAAGRVAGLLSEAVNIDVFLARHGGAFKRSPPLTDDHYAVAVARGNRDLLDAVNAVIRELAASGRLSEMTDRVRVPGENLDDPH